MSRSEHDDSHHGSTDRIQIDLRLSDIHIHHHEVLDPRTAAALERLNHNMARVELLLKTLQTEEKKEMALQKESLDLLKRIDDGTTKVSDRIKQLLDNPSTSEADFRAALRPIADHLDEIGKDPNAPVPDLPVV